MLSYERCKTNEGKKIELFKADGRKTVSQNKTAVCPSFSVWIKLIVNFVGSFYKRNFFLVFWKTEK